MEDTYEGMPALELVPERPATAVDAPVPAIPADRRERAMDIAIKQHCAKEAKENEDYRAWVLKTTGKQADSAYDYDADADFLSIKKKHGVYEAAKKAGFIPHTRVYDILHDAEVLVSLLLDPSARIFHRSPRAAKQQRERLKAFETIPEFKDLVPSALTRVVD